MKQDLGPAGAGLLAGGTLAARSGGVPTSLPSLIAPTARPPEDLRLLECFATAVRSWGAISKHRRSRGPLQEARWTCRTASPRHSPARPCEKGDHARGARALRRHWHSRCPRAGRGGRSARDLLPLVYEELRRLAAARLAHEAHGQTLTPTALVHEAYLRLVGGDPGRRWEGRGHFFAAAAEAMRRILVDRARDRRRLKRGGGRARIDLDLAAVSVDVPGDDLIDLDEALTELGRGRLCPPARAAVLRRAGQAEAAVEALGPGPAPPIGTGPTLGAWLYQIASGERRAPCAE